MSWELFYEPADRLRATKLNDRSYATVRPVWAAPLTHPNRFLCLMDEKGEEIGLIFDPRQELTAESWAAVQEELRRRDLTAEITAVVAAREEWGATYWSVQTDRGPRDFVTQNLSENAVWFGESRLLLLDVEGNRFEVPQLEALDSRSQTIIDTIL